MTPLDLDAFLALPWSANVRAKLRERAGQVEIQALAAWDTAGRLTASSFTALPDPRELPDNLVAIWCKTVPATPDPVKSKTMQALDLILQEGLTPHAAAKQLGVHASAVYRALDRAQQKPLCPCCGQVVREGFEVDRTVLKDPAPAPDAA